MKKITIIHSGAKNPLEKRVYPAGKRTRARIAQAAGAGCGGSNGGNQRQKAGLGGVAPLYLGSRCTAAG